MMATNVRNVNGSCAHVAPVEFDVRAYDVASLDSGVTPNDVSGVPHHPHDAPYAR